MRFRSVFPVLLIAAYAPRAAALSRLNDRQSGPSQRVLGSAVIGADIQDGGNPCHGKRQLNGFVAFGDSYSAGIGTYVNGTENECRQGNGAYPVLLESDLAFLSRPSSPAFSFQWLSCTGSRTEDLLSGSARSQVDKFNNTPDVDFATLSIGGNDLGFFDVMNACVFRFYSFYSGTCETALAVSEEQLTSSAFKLRLGLVLMEILDKIQWEKRPNFAITVTGYARFFNADTEPCDDMSLGVWWGPAATKMKRSVRKRMNDLVLAANERLKSGIEEINGRFARPKVFFVDYDSEFDGHRFCEPGVQEPDYMSTNTWFFLPAGLDNARDVAPVVETDTISPGSPLVDPETCLAEAERSGDWGAKVVCYMAMAKKRDPALRPRHDRIMAKDSMWYVPTSYGKTFHPRSLGHEVIRDRIYKVWDEQGF
ncbi:SGNH hydrolase-type esterase domain-containing protein [Podospora didyma]|uniref:SGNH hydrolase-type esterase domain-containing protein n=1 Tax=Podospora didyma TaxID=330526 RepID=A0AAE0KEL2_9PEZI|nr:SGNH hydrolase-type esterase domain-containing protein [Podospora didyma]